MNKIKINVYIVSLILYTFAFSYFFFVFQNKIIYFSSEQWHRSQKILIDTMSSTKNKYKKIYLITNEPMASTLLYSYYQVNDAKKIKKTISDSNGKFFDMDNIRIQNTCPTKRLDENNLYIIKKELCGSTDGKIKKAEYKLTPLIEAYDHSGTVYWQMNNLK